MTWTLRLYDGGGVEIGWVTVDPYEHQITHPDGPDAYSGLRFRLRRLEDPIIKGGFVEKIGTEVSRTQQWEGVDVSGREHLEYVDEQVSTLDEVASTDLADE